MRLRRKRQTAPTRAQRLTGVLSAPAQLNLAAASLLRHVVGLHLIDKIFFGQHPIFERQRVFRQLVAEHLVSMLAHDSPREAGRERLWLLNGCYGTLFHDVSPSVLR